MQADRILELRNLTTEFATSEGVAKAVDGLDLHVGKGETLAVVGESGCGKSVTALSILRLVPAPPGRIAGGEIILDGRDLLKLSDPEMRAVRGKEVSMIFQEPMTSLNPVFTIGRQIIEAIVLHEKLSRRAARARAIEMLDLVRLPEPQRRIDDYPHRLSGGMRQRVMIAMALCCRPKLLIADEPTTALDVTIQSQILDLLKNLQREFDMGLMLITHDLGVVAETAQRVVVMYAGRKVEEAPVRAIFASPKHPYTQGLLEATPHAPKAAGGRRRKLNEIPGVVPSLYDMPLGCAFAPRCGRAVEQCRRERPADAALAPGHRAACFVAQAEAR
jgi:peptide/nickel transport system ATP-binding protein